MTDIEKLHSLYNSLTGFNLSMRYDRERSWYEFLKAGFTEDNLRLVITHLKRGIRNKERHSGCLKFSNLIEPLQNLEEEIQIARAFNRNNRPQTNKEVAIEIFRPTVCEPVLTINCKPAKEVVKSLIEQLRRAAE